MLSFGRASRNGEVFRLDILREIACRCLLAHQVSVPHVMRSRLGGLTSSRRHRGYLSALEACHTHVRSLSHRMRAPGLGPAVHDDGDGLDVDFIHLAGVQARALCGRGGGGRGERNRGEVIPCGEQRGDVLGLRGVPAAGLRV